MLPTSSMKASHLRQVHRYRRTWYQALTIVQMLFWVPGARAHHGRHGIHARGTSRLGEDRHFKSVVQHTV